MAELELHAHIAAPVELVYAVVADVERYPEFLPDVAAVERRGDQVAMTLRMGPVSSRLVTRARFDAPASIELALVEGPFRRFDARWSFAPAGTGTDVRYSATYELPLFGALLGGPAAVLLRQQVQRQIGAFEARVRRLADERPDTA